MLWESKIELGEKFFQEIIRHPVPLDMNTLKALSRSSLGLDLYLWVTYRTFTLKRPMRLSSVVPPVRCGARQGGRQAYLDILAALKDDDSYGAHSGCMPE